jgi:hypothetical protein
MLLRATGGDGSETRPPRTFTENTGQRHQIEDRIVEPDKAGRAVESDREAISAEPRLDRKADMQIIVDNPNPTHTGPQPSATRWTNAYVDRAMAFAAANQRRLQLHADATPCLPGKVYRNFFATR